MHKQMEIVLQVHLIIEMLVSVTAGFGSGTITGAWWSSMKDKVLLPSLSLVPLALVSLVMRSLVRVTHLSLSLSLSLSRAHHR